MLLCRLGLAIRGQVGYDGKPGRPGIMWLAGFHGGIDDCGRRELALCMLLSDPLLDFAEDVRHGEVQMVRRRRDDRDLRPALRELSLEDGQRQLGSDFGLPGEDRDHPRFKGSFGLPHEALKGLVRFTAPAHPVREGLRLDAGQFGRRLPIAPTTDGVQDDGRSVIRQLRLAAL